MQYVGIDWAYRRASWCALSESGATAAEGVVAADGDGLARLVLRLGVDVGACVEMISGAVWVRDRLEEAGWEVLVADAKKVKGLAPLACKTDKIDARVLAELSWRDLVPAIWLPDPTIRRERELARRLQLVRHRTTLKNRIHATLISFGHHARWPTCSGSRGASCSTGWTSPIRGAQRRRQPRADRRARATDRSDGRLKRRAPTTAICRCW